MCTSLYGFWCMECTLLGFLASNTMTYETLPIIISSCSLVISAVVAYLTLFRKGDVKMTQPTTIAFSTERADKSDAPKVYLRTLLYSTAKRGNVISSLHLRLTRGETAQTFNIWVYGEKELSRGSGLFVGEQGVVLNHHFWPPNDGSTFKFLPGTYVIELFAAQVDHPKPKLLWTVNLDLPQQLFEQMESDPAGMLHFDWQPNSGSYHAHFRPS